MYALLDFKAWNMNAKEDKGEEGVFLNLVANKTKW